MIIDGVHIAQEIQAEIKAAIAVMTTRKPHLAVIQIGSNPASSIYVRRKMKACADVGILSTFSHLPDTVHEKELLAAIDKLNHDTDIDAILIQLPLPKHIDAMSIMQQLDPAKDVDGFHPINMGKLLIGDTSGYIPCTPLGIKTLLDRSGIVIPGKHAVIVGRSNIVGKPMAALLMQNTPNLNATVTVAHSHSKDLKALCQEADILIAAVGKKNCITADMIKEGAIVIDVGINQIEDPQKRGGYRLCGDVNFASVQPKCSFITPVPGGVGPMTIAMLLSNTLLSHQRRKQ